MVKEGPKMVKASTCTFLRCSRLDIFFPGVSIVSAISSCEVHQFSSGLRVARVHVAIAGYDLGYAVRNMCVCVSAPNNRYSCGFKSDEDFAVSGLAYVVSPEEMHCSIPFWNRISVQRALLLSNELVVSAMSVFQ